MCDGKDTGKCYRQKKLYPLVLPFRLFFITVIFVVFKHAFFSAEKNEEDNEKLIAPDQELPEEKQEEADYLRKFQYRKNTKLGSIKSDPQPGSKAAIMKRVLLKQPRVRVFIPRNGTESPAIKQSVTLNGYRLDLPKQAYHEVPQQVADVIMDSLSQTEAAILRNQINGDKAKETALL